MKYLFALTLLIAFTGFSSAAFAADEVNNSSGDSSSSSESRAATLDDGKNPASREPTSSSNLEAMSNGELCISGECYKNRAFSDPCRSTFAQCPMPEMRAEADCVGSSCKRDNSKSSQ